RDMLDEPLHLNLTRAPTEMRLLSDGTFGSLSFRLDGGGGEVIRAEWGSSAFMPYFFDGVWEVPSTFHPERAHDAQLDGDIAAEDLQGSLFLEAVSYSRALPPGQERIGTGAAATAFTYGLLPAVPVSFEVAPQARHLVFWNDAPSSPPAWVAVYGPDDRKLASVPVPAGTRTSLAVDVPGTYVVALLAGNATMGADAAPGTFGLAPVKAKPADLPERPAGRGGEYGQDNASAPAGVVYAAEPVYVEDQSVLPMPSIACFPGESVRIVQGGETLAAWGPAWEPGPLPAGVLIGAGDVTVWHDGFGDSGCARLAARLWTYQR
ncbi:MAG: hypothetical protein LC620_07905, partial [Halobacteriales archaeon]|nr:hypothetical protein [Halobacteriales archaeon]